MRKERNRAILALAISIVIFLGCSISSWGKEEVVVNTGVAVQKKVENAAKIASARQNVATDLVAALGNTKYSPGIRIECARALARLNYVEAIPIIIDLIDISNPEGESSEAVIGTVYPCVRVLADYGIAAVPALVETWIKEDNKLRRTLLLAAVRNGEEKGVARTYIKGLVEQTKSREFQEKASALLVALD